MTSRIVFAMLLASPFVNDLEGAERSQKVLSQGWFLREVEAADLARVALAEGLGKLDSDWLTVAMPAQVHDVLLAHGKIPDPRIGRNAAQSAWVAERNWAYACRFKSPESPTGPVFLCFEGLDTLATAYLNGADIGRFDNMHRQYAVDVRGRLKPPGEENLLALFFPSPLRHLESLQPVSQYKDLPRYKFLRKCHSDFGSYLGARPHSVKVGVFRDVLIDVPGSSWIEDVWAQATLSANRDQATVRVRVETKGSPSPLTWSLRSPAGDEVARGDRPNKMHDHEWTIDVKNPRLWWPWTHGRPEVYTLHVKLMEDGRLQDSRSVPVGIREVRPVLADPQTGEKRFRFEVNGRPIFLRGACWAPLEGMTHCWDSKRAGRLLDLMEHGRMNVVRVWGEGHLPPDEFYAECDRRGIFVWQDFMFGYGMHPSGYEPFDANCRAEIEGMIRRLRNHPCILLWVGGNENHMGWDFQHGTRPTVGNRLFEEIMPQACARLDPGRLFHPSSPFGGPQPNWPLEGDWHDYTTLKFCPEASVPLFASEVGRVSAPSLSSMKRFLSDEELWPQGHSAAIRSPGQAAWPPMWQYRSVDGSWDKVGKLGEYCDPASADDLICVLGTAHGEYLRDRVERERRGVPDGGKDGNRRCWGNMVWRLNDSWPIIYWSVIDYYLEPKIAYYHLRRAYDPVLVSFERTADWMAVWVVNDSPQSVAGTLVVSRRQFNGKTVGELRTEVSLKPGEASRCLRLSDLGTVVLRSEYLQASFEGKEATCLLIGDRYLRLPKARLTARATGDAIEIGTDSFARQVVLEIEGVTGAVFEDNFFDLAGGQKRSVRLLNTAGGRRLKIRALNAEAVALDLKAPEGSHGDE
jgi:hypothetical protein